MRKTSTFTITSLVVLALAVALSASAARAIRAANAIWVDGSLYDTVITDTSFLAPPEQSTDTIYSFMTSGLTGQRSIADAAPGDPDFNGGRWSVKMVVFTAQGVQLFDPDGDGAVNFEMMSDAELLQHAADGDVEIYETTFYFECPVLPRRGH